ncbi:MAG: hypothetical protein LZ174_10015, partial [Thaumarchaeota archaeon]|nr:hypothetical protein [Candidatus Geocrenenecus arthurdayi]
KKLYVYIINIFMVLFSKRTGLQTILILFGAVFPSWGSLIALTLDEVEAQPRRHPVHAPPDNA